MKRFPMKRKTKYAFRSYSFPGERDYKSDRQHMWSKWRRRYMRLFIKRDTEREIDEELKQLVP